ncbi:MAG TPA: phosphodiesterase [Hellea balneolensis]|uniref:Phosphodiesterase n=1 Tax=Hellea balneolensis TaxID=287478 RepID=A0A7C5QR66_9PROT|nr:phosphodiesterase [Hellea balneolensis]
MNAELNTATISTLGERITGGDPVFMLMGAAVYELNFTDKGETFSWRDKAVAASLLHCRPDDLPQGIRPYVDRLCDDAPNVRKQAVKSLSWNGAKYQIDYQIRTFDGRNIWVEEKALRLEGDGRQPTKIIGVISNIQSRKIREEQAGYHAAFDSRTGLWNRTRMAEGLTQMLAFTKRYKRASSYLAMRLTNLNDINTTYGYEAGDRLLRAVAKRLTACVRAPDICGRVSGSTFGIGLSDCDHDNMQKVAERIVKILSDQPYGSPHGDLYAEFAVGGYDLDGGDNQVMGVSAADAMEYVCTAVAHSEMRQGAFVPYSQSLPDLKPKQRISELTREDIIRALNERRITLAYQPIVHARSRETHHFECLLRLRRDDGEMVSAAEFIMAAERLNCVHLLDRRALEIGAQALIEHSHIQVALNVSAATVKSKDTADAYLQALRGLGLNTKRVTLELTETVALEDPAMASRFSVEARALGCQFAIDDFGAGYTTFRNLMAIEADEIKIDGSFIRELSITPHKQTFVRMMVDLAQTFSVKTVAEMVESREDADLLTRLGVDYLQGYMFGLPGPAPVVGLKKTKS